jgi:hypothetical protein
MRQDRSVIFLNSNVLVFESVGVRATGSGLFRVPLVFGNQHSPVSSELEDLVRGCQRGSSSP